MAVTGLSLIFFLIVHVTVNACMWAVVFVPGDNGEIFNKAAHWLGQTLVPRVLEIGLFVFIIIHIIQGYVLEVQNRQRRGIGYNVKMGSRGSAWYRKSMGLLGTLIFLFLIVHIADFWIPSRFGGLNEVVYDDSPGRVYHNLYGKMMMVFQNPLDRYSLCDRMYFSCLAFDPWLSKFFQNIGCIEQKISCHSERNGLGIFNHRLPLVRHDAG